MVDFSEVGLFKTKDGRKVTYETLLQDIYENSEESRETLRTLVEQLSSLMTRPSDALQLMEHIVGLMDTQVKNDDILVKVANIVARIIQRGMTSVEASSEWEITEDEKRRLLDEAEKVLSVDNTRTPTDGEK